MGPPSAAERENLNTDPLRRLDRFYDSGTPSPISTRPSLCFEAAGGQEINTPNGPTLVLTRKYAWEALPGGPSLEAIRHSGWRPATLDQRLPERTPLTRLACVDIETTGLSLGAGTVAFLVGVISALPEGAVLKQFLIRDFSEEAAQQLLLALHLDEMEVLCTYNGARFDLPILRSRSVINRIEAPWLQRPHLDLLYPVRSIWRKIWPDCRLATSELRLLGVVRHEDCEGWEVPLKFRQFLNDPAEASLLDVLEHNAQDLVSLLCLCAVMERIYSDDFAGFGLSQSELLGLARSLCARKRRESGLRMYAQARSLGRLAPDYGHHMRHYVRLLKKQSDWLRARDVWQELARSGEGQDRFWAHLEEAKFLEHRQKSAAAALDATRAAREELSAFPDPSRQQRLAAELETREVRLQRQQKAG
jgi:uncharacterized protein YprB with RNaseH-like and TPR domain